MNKRNSIKFIVIGICVCIAVFAGLFLTRNLGKRDSVVDRESSISKLNKFVKKIEPATNKPVKGTISYSDDNDAAKELPELTDESLAVSCTGKDDYVEIFASSEKTGTDSDGYLREMAEEFNRSNATTSTGDTVGVKVRTVSSGQQVDYVASGKYVPDAISPSSKLQVKMLNAKGVDTEYISDSLVMNYAGFVVNSKTYSTLVEEYGEASVNTLAKATSDGRVVMGYTNPFTSAAGLNFLVTLLDSYSSGNISSDKAIEGFQSFQENIPFVAMTTGQMRASADKGTFDAFVCEYQTFVNDKNLVKNYKFIPFGFEHENPLAAIDSASEQHKEILKLFAEYCEQNGKELAKSYGFNEKPEGYTYMPKDYSGQELILAQELYKEHKDTKPVVCVFVTDISGSMDGKPLNSLKSSLINSIQYINEDNYIGLVSFNGSVSIDLPIGKFDLNQQSLFKGTVERLSSLGATATYDAVCVALDMLVKQAEQTPDAKFIVFLLSDGESNCGYTLNEVSKVIKGLQIPIYTINYNNGTSQEMDALSSINEGAAINANSDDVTYQLKQLFNANM